jgi:hypothetical protein
VAFVDVTDPNYKPEGSSGFVDVTAPGYKPTPRSALGEIGTSLARGALVGLPEMTGMALQYASSPGNAVYEAGKSIRTAAEARGATPGLTLHPEEHGAVVNALAQGGEMLPSVAAPIALGAGALAALPVAVPTLAGTGLVAAGAAAPFAAQAGQSTLEKAQKAGLPEDEATTAARLNAGLTFGSQTALGFVGGNMFGRGGQFFGNLVRKDGADLGAQTMAELTGRSGVVAPFAKSLAASGAEAVAVGGAQAAGSAAIEKAYGVDTKDPWDAAIEQAPAMLGLTAMLGPFALAGRALRANALAKRAEALGSKDTAPAIRDQLATQYFTELNKVDPAAAKQFALNADLAIKNGMPLQVDAGLFREGAVQPPKRPEGTLALPSPYDFVAGRAGVGRDAEAVRSAKEPQPGSQPLLPAPPVREALARPGLPTTATEVHGPSRAELEAQRRDEQRAAEENRLAMVQTHAHIVEELKAAGEQPTEALSFPQFRDAMAAEAKKAGLKADDLTPDDYRSMWEKHQQDVMNENLAKAQKLAFRVAEESRKAPTAEAGSAPRSALATALEDALKHQQVDLAYRERERARQADLDKLANVGAGGRMADAAARDEVLPGAKTLPHKAESVIQELRAVKPADQAMPPKLMKEVTAALEGKKSLEDQLAALRELRDAKGPETASYELLDKLHSKLGGEEPAAPAAPAAPAPTKSAAGRPKGTTDDRHTIGPPNEVGELLPYTRTLSQARDGAGGIFGEKQWWQDLAWAVRNPNTKIGKELLENGKVTNEQIGLALARDERYQAADVLLEEMRVKREERLRAQLLAEAQPEAAKEILRAKDLVNIFGGDEGDYDSLGKVAPPGSDPKLRSLLAGSIVHNVRDLLGRLQALATDPAHKRLIEDLQRLQLDTKLTLSDRELGGGRVGLYNEAADHVLIGRGGATMETVLHEITHPATIRRLDEGAALLSSIRSGEVKASQLSPEQQRVVKATSDLLDVMSDAAAREGYDQHYGMKNPKEFVAEAMTNAAFQKFLRGGLWQRFVDAVKRILNLRMPENLLDRAMQVSREFLGDAKRDSVENFEASPVQAAEQTDRVMAKVASAADVPLSIKQGFTRAHLAFTTLNHIRQVFKDVLPAPFKNALDDYGAAKDRTKTMVETRNREALEISRNMAALADVQPGLDAKLYRLMGEATRQGIFPERPIEQQPWAAKQTPDKVRKYNELRAMYQSHPALQEAYKAAAEFNRTDYDRIYATVMRNIARYSEMPRDLWKAIDVTKGRGTEVQALEQWLLTHGTDEQRIAARGARAQYNEKQQGPYFHLGRNGSYFTRFNIADTPEARAAYEQEFGVSPLSGERIVTPDDRHVFARFESPGEWNAVVAKLNKLRQAGHIEPEMQAGQLETMVGQLDSSAPSFVRGLLRNIEADTRLDPDQKKDAQDVLRRLSIEMLPETSASKAFAQRKGVAGYDADMNRSFVKRAASSAYFTAHNSIRPEIEDSLLALKQGVQSLQDATSPHYDNARGLVASALQNEIKQRQANELLPTRTPILDNVSALSHSFYLAANPAFFMMKTLQPWQLALPQLGARHGFVRSFGAMTKATATALGIIRDTIGDGWQRGQWRGIIDPNIVIDKSRATAAEKTFLKALIDAGGATFTQAHDMGQIAAGESQGVSTAVKLGNASMHYSEALDRMTAGLAAFNLEMKRTGDVEKSTQYGIQMVKNSLFDYNTHNRGRMFSKQGMFGPATPLLTQFAQYQIQTLELLGRLTTDAFGKLDPSMTPAERDAAIAEKGEARRALAGTMATTMVLAGTMGLPAVSVLTAAYNALFGSKDAPADAQSDFRNFLADTFGKDAGEIIAHGAFRAVGSDLGGSHLGFQDIVPFSRFLADRRKLQDRFDAGAISMMGPAVGAASGFAYGLQNMLQGRYIKGLEQMLPSGLKGVAKAAELGEHGLTDLQGNKLPVEITSWDMFNQLLNSTPAKVAEQKEAQRGANTTAMLLKQRSMSLKENFAVAAERGDAESMRTITEEIGAFNKQNPDFAVRDLTGILRQRAIDRAVAEQTNVTGKVKQLPRLQDEARFANVRGMP